MAPLFHAAGSVAVLATVWIGGCQVILPAFDATAALDAIAAEQVTVTLGVPTMIAASPRSNWATTAGGESAVAQPWRVAHCYGGGASSPRRLPECRADPRLWRDRLAPMATTLRHEEKLVESDLARSCGQAVAGVDIRVVDPSGHDLPPGEIGEVVVRGPNVMQGSRINPHRPPMPSVTGGITAAIWVA